jgi:phytoene dehydrogenase-like protein
MKEKKVVIIGAGIAGLSAGCYARMNGYQAEVLESHTLPGGLCTSWKRKGYTIDGSCHWVVGSGPGSSLYPVWEELGAVQGRTFIDYDYFVRMTGADGRVFTMYTDVDRLESHMKALSPADAAPTEKLCGYVRGLAGFSMPVGKPGELMGMLDGIRMMRRFGPYMKLFQEIGSTNLGQFAAQFKDPLLREGLANALFGASSSLFPLVMTLGPMSRKQSGYPLGGSLEYARSIEARLRGLGGKVSYGARAQKILEKDGKATGVLLTDGRVIEADIVISASDMKSTLFSLLDGSRVHPAHRELLENGTTIDPCVQVSFGVNMSFPAAEPGMSEAFKLPQPITIGGRTIEWFNAKHYGYDPSLAPAGKTVLMSMFLTDWSHWEKLKDDKAAYAAEKARIEADCRKALEHAFPGIAGKIEMVDVATPLTYARYSGNRKGVYMTWNITPEFRKKYRFIPKTVPGLGNFYLASMWTNAPGGLPGAVMAGREVVQLLCSKDRKRFVTSTPAAHRTARSTDAA